MALFISGYMGGPDVELTLASRISKQVAQLREQYHDRFNSPDAARLDVAFEYPGTVSRPEFEGFKQGKHSKKRKMTQIWIAVPERLLNSPEFADFYFQALEAALEQGKRKFDSSEIVFPLEEYRSLLREMAKRY